MITGVCQVNKEHFERSMLCLRSLKQNAPEIFSTLIIICPERDKRFFQEYGTIVTESDIIGEMNFPDEYLITTSYSVRPANSAHPVSRHVIIGDSRKIARNFMKMFISKFITTKYYFVIDYDTICIRTPKLIEDGKIVVQVKDGVMISDTYHTDTIKGIVSRDMSHDAYLTHCNNDTYHIHGRVIHSHSVSSLHQLIEFYPDLIEQDTAPFIFFRSSIHILPDYLSVLYGCPNSRRTRNDASILLNIITECVRGYVKTINVWSKRFPKHRNIPEDRIFLEHHNLPEDRNSPHHNSPHHNYPLVSCLMITQNRYNMALKAIQCFKRQTYPNKELIIIDTGKDQLNQYVKDLKDPTIKLFYFSPEEGQFPLEYLRRISVDKSRGPFLIQWDDDDYHHCSRIGIMMNSLRENGSDVVFSSRLMLAWPDKGYYTISNKGSWRQSMLIKRDKALQYIDTKFEYLSQVVPKIKGLEILYLREEYCILYMYIVHGANTNHYDYFMKLFTKTRFISQDPQVRKTLARLSGCSSVRGLDREVTPPTIYVPAPNIIFYGLLFLLAFLIVVAVIVTAYRKKKKRMS